MSEEQDNWKAIQRHVGDNATGRPTAQTAQKVREYLAGKRTPASAPAEGEEETLPPKPPVIEGPGTITITPPPVFVTPPPVLAVPQATYTLPDEFNIAAMNKAFGTASSSGGDNLAWFSFPHPKTRLYSRTGSLLSDHVGDSRLDHRTNKAIAERLTNALAEIFVTLGQAEFEKQGWHVYGGSHNYRPTTSGGRLSTHAWAAAVDMNPNENWYTNTKTTFSAKAIDIMEKWGFLSGGRAWGIDWMHFQACIPKISKGSYYATKGLPKNIIKG